MKACDVSFLVEEDCGLKIVWENNFLKTEAHLEAWIFARSPLVQKLAFEKGEESPLENNRP